MYHLIQFLLAHGYLVLFGFVLAEQIGLPIPAVPILLAMGALTGSGHFGFVEALLLAAAAATLGDLLWYTLGRRRGYAVVKFLCRLSLEPDSCVRRTTDIFGRLGFRSLLVAKFIPGFSTAAPPLAGIGKSPVWRFLLWDAAGSLVWAGTFLGAGVLFSSEIERLAEWALHLGSWLVVLLFLALAAYIGLKYSQRRKLLRSLRVARITPVELKSRVDAGEDVLIVDLRHPDEFALDGETLPGAIRMESADVETLPDSIPREREIVLYCS